MKLRTYLTDIVAFAAVSVSAKLTVTRLTCNYQGDPAAPESGYINDMAVTEGDIRLGWQMAATANGESQSAYEITIRENVTNKTVYASGKVKSGQSQLVNAPALRPNRHGYYWQVRVWNEKDEASDLSGKQEIRVVPNKIDAEWIGAITKKDAKIPEGRFSNAVFKKDSFKTKWADVDTLSTKSIILRKEFSLEGKQVADAVLYVSGMGHYKLSINGTGVGNAEFAPVWSEYDKTVYYNVFDVTQLLATGDNAIGVLLGNGMFNVQRMGRYSKLQTSFGPPQMLLRMEINYADGTQQVIKSGQDWKYDFSPITFNTIYGGESYDARLEQTGYDRAGFDDTKWRNAVLTEGPKGRLTVQTVQPVRIMERYGIKSWKPIPADSLAAASKATKRDIHPSAFVADMGQNLAGFPEIVVSGKRGQKVTMLVAEKLTPQGACDQRQTGRQHYYEYTLKGDGQEVWHPHFSYYGFQYIQVEGAVLEGQPNPDGLPVLKRLNSCFIYNSAEEVSSFECSNPLFTQTHRLIERAERSNMQSVLSDCPHREKLGWLEQDHLCGPSLLYNYDMTPRGGARRARRGRYNL